LRREALASCCGNRPGFGRGMYDYRPASRGLRQGAIEELVKHFI